MKLWWNITCLPVYFILHVRTVSFLGMYVFAVPSLKHRETIVIFSPVLGILKGILKLILSFMWLPLDHQNTNIYVSKTTISSIFFFNKGFLVLSLVYWLPNYRPLSIACFISNILGLYKFFLRECLTNLAPCFRV